VEGVLEVCAGAGLVVGVGLLFVEGVGFEQLDADLGASAAGVAAAVPALAATRVYHRPADALPDERGGDVAGVVALGELKQGDVAVVLKLLFGEGEKVVVEP
jgi:hypothetical protein